MSAVMVETDRDLKAAARAYELAERRIETLAIERRRQDRQFDDFRADLFRIRVTSRDDGLTATVFHGEKQESRRERMLREHREQEEAELRRKERSRVLAVRRRTGQRSFCRHCGRIVPDGPKCASCKANPELVTARGSETRSFVPRLEAQPEIQPLSEKSKVADTLICELPSRLRDALELRYFKKQSDVKCAQQMGVSVAVFAGLAKAAVQDVAMQLANIDAARIVRR